MSLQLRPEETALYSALFTQVEVFTLGRSMAFFLIFMRKNVIGCPKLDTEKKGLIGGAASVEFFRKSKLPDETLGKIWQLSNASRSGSLNRKEFDIAMRLIAVAQTGKEPTLTSISARGVGPVASVAPTAATATRATSSPKPPTENINQLTVSAEDKQKCKTLFDANQVNNAVEGDRARAIFMASGLAVDLLRDIWTLADMDNDGRLTLTEFTVGMVLINLVRTGKIQSVPATLPPTFLQSIKGTPAPAPTPAPDYSALSALSSPSPSSPPPSFLQPLQPSLIPGSSAPIIPSLTPVATPSPALNLQPATSWVITPEERARFSAIFDQQDVRRQGALGGNDLRDFLMRTGLPQNVLGQVWQLSDSGNKGFLTKDEFCITLKLLNRCLAGLDLPQTLPQELQIYVASSSPPSGVSPADVTNFGMEGAVLILEKRRELEAEERAIKEMEGKIESFQQDVDDLKRRRVTLEEEIAQKTRDSEQDQQRLHELQQQLEQGMTHVRNLETTVGSQSAEIQSKRAILTQQETKVKSLQQEKVKMSETVSKEQARVQNQILTLQHTVSQLRNQLSEVENQKRRIQQIIENQTSTIEKVKNDEEVADVDTTFVFAPPRQVESAAAAFPESPLTHGFPSFFDSFGGPVTTPQFASFGNDGFDGDHFGSSGAMDPFDPTPVKPIASIPSTRSQTHSTSSAASFAKFDDDGFGSLASSKSSLSSTTSATSATSKSLPPLNTRPSFASFDDDPLASPAFGTTKQASAAPPAFAASSPFDSGFEAPSRPSSEASRQVLSAFDDAFGGSPLQPQPPNKSGTAARLSFEDSGFGSGAPSGFSSTSKAQPSPVPQLSPQTSANPKLAALVTHLRSLGFTQDEKKLINALSRYDYDVEKATNYLLDNP